MAAAASYQRGSGRGSEDASAAKPLPAIMARPASTTARRRGPDCNDGATGRHHQAALSDPARRADPDTCCMTHYLVAVLAALAAAVAFIVALPSGADSVEWELPSISAR